MTEKESTLGRIIEVIKKLTEPSTARRGAALKPEKGAQRVEAAKKIISFEQKRAKEWVEQATSNDPEVRKQAQQKARGDVYRKTLEEAKDHLKAAQGGDQSKTPDWLPRDADTIQSAPLAEFTATVTSLPEDLQKDPSVLYREAAKLYRSTDWKASSPTERRETRRTIDSTIKKAIEIAPTSVSSALFTDIAARKSGNYYFEVGLSGEDSFDLYQSRVVPEKQPLEDTSKIDDKDKRAEVRKENERRERHNKEVDSLERLLTQTQRQLDIYGEENQFQQGKILENVRNTIVRGINDGKFTEQIAGEHRDLADLRLKELGQLKEQQEAKVSGRRYDIRTPQFTKEQVEAYIQKLPTSARAIAEEALTLSQNEAAKPEEIRQKIEVLRQASSYDAIERSIKAELGETIDQDTLIREFQERRRALSELEDLISSSAIRRLDYRPDRGYFGQHEDDLRFVSDSREYEAVRLNADGSIDIEHKTTKELIKIAHWMLDRGDSNERAMFNENFDMLYDQADWKTFIGKIEDGLRSVRTADGRPVWSEAQIVQYRAQFMAIREMRELAHNVQLVANTSGLDMLEKVVLYSVAGDFDVWFRYNKGLRYTFAMQLENLRHIMGLNAGYLPPEELALAAGTFNSRWRQMSLELMRQAKESGMAGFRDMSEEDMVRTGRIANALGIITLRTPIVMSEANIPPNFTSAEWNGLVQDVDAFRHLIFKYGIGKQGLVNLYRAVTKDDNGAIRLSSLTDEKAMYEMFKLAQHDPKWGYALANFRNLFQVADRMGDGKSFWGVLMASKHWSKEMKEVRGVGIKIFDAANRATDEIKTKELAHRFGTDYEKKSAAEKREQQLWWEHRSGDPDVTDAINVRTRELCQEAMQEALWKLPGEIIDRASIYPGYEGLRFRAVQIALETADVGTLNAILKNPDGKWAEINKNEISSLYDLYRANPATNPTLYEGLSHTDKTELARRLDLLNTVAYQMAKDLSLVQQLAVEDLIAKARAGSSGSIKRDMLKDFVDNISGPDATNRKARVRAYIEAIQTVVYQPYQDTVTETQKPAFFNTLVDRFSDGREFNIFTSSDIPLDEFRFSQWGSTVPGRTIGDAKAISTGEKAMGEFFSKFFEAKPDPDKMFEFVGENIKKTMAVADDRIGLNAAGFCIDSHVAFHREKDWVTWMGILGDVITSGQMIEFVEYVSNLPGIRILTKGKVPDYLYGAAAQRFANHDAAKYGADRVREVILGADGKNLLPKEHHPFGWGPNIFSISYTRKGMIERYHATLPNLVMEALMTAGPIAAGLMIIEAAKEQSEAEKRS